MSIEIFLLVLTILATVTSLLTEAVKKFLDSLKFKYITNVVVLIIAIIVGAVGMGVYYIFNGLDWSVNNIICTVLMVVFNWLGAMLGYDKVIQAITQVKGDK